MTTIDNVARPGFRRISALAAVLWIFGSTPLGAQVTEGDLEVISVRETDPTLGPLVTTLVALGVASLLATTIFWWLTRPTRTGGH